MSDLERYPDLTDEHVKKILETMDFFDEHLRGKKAEEVSMIKERYGEQFVLPSNSNFTRGKWPTKRNTFLLERAIQLGNSETKRYYPLKYTVHLALGISKWDGKFTSNRLETKIKATSIGYVHKEEDEDWLEDKGVDIWGEFSSKSTIENLSKSKIATSNNSSIDSIINTILRHKLVILEGVPGTGKTHVFKKIIDRFDFVRFLTFHPSSDYSNFVGGIRPGKDKETGELVFNPTKGHLLKIIDEANKGTVILWIDELNRANVPRVFGDLISLIGNSDPPELWIPNVGIKATDQKLTLSKKQIKNLHIVGTMNTSDRSVTPLDAALRRRFSFIRLNPMKRSELLALELKNNKYSLSSISDDLICFEKINDLMLEKLGSDAALGHSYIIEMSQYPSDDNKRNLMWKYSILPNIIDTLMISQNFDLIGEINSIISNFTGLKLVDSAKEGMGLGLGRMILVEEVQE